LNHLLCAGWISLLNNIKSAESIKRAWPILCLCCLLACQSGVWTSASGVKLGEKVIGGYVSYHDSSNSGAAYCPEGAVLIGLINDKSLDSYHMACQVLK
ncbi:hypothetical protein ABZR78_34145, partial [Pseudomonas aeruginosa]